MATVDFERVDKVYADGNQAIAGVDLRVEDGELMVVVGPSGCGKSSLLRLLAGLELVSAGTIRIGDRVVNDLKPQERNIAMVFQDYALYPHRTVRGNLEFPLKMRKLARAEIDKRVEWVAELLSLTRNLERFPRQLSGGERQRVAMGRALVREPTVFLLDEPLSNLDAKLRTEVRAEIAELQRRTGTTMFYVTHDQVEAMTLGHRVTVLDRGRVQQTATPRDLYERPANAFVAGFIGNPPMNLFPASLRIDERGEPLLVIGEQSAPISPPGLTGDALRSLVGRRLTAGVRAEAVRLASDGAGTLGAVVEHVERLGHETLAAIQIADATGVEAIRWIVRLPAVQDLAKGQAVRLQLEPKSVYFFGEDGKAL